MTKPKLEDVLAEVAHKRKRREAWQPLWLFVAVVAIGFVLYVFAEGLGVVFG